MIYQATSTPRGEGRLWAIALGLSLVVNGGLIVLLAFASMRSEMLRKNKSVAAAPAPETVVTIFPEIASVPSPAANTVEPPAAPAAAKPRFARTSDDQASAPPKGPAFIGERDTTATSDKAPDPSAPELPSQKGDKPLHEDDLETTESRYRDGSLSGNPSPPPVPAASTPALPPAPVPEMRPEIPAEPMVAEKTPAVEEAAKPAEMTPPQASTPKPAELLAGPNPVDVQVPKPADEKREPKPTPSDRPQDNSLPPSKPASLPKPASPPAAPVSDPAFAGNQKKASIVGSISRTGRSALNVADTPLGRYQALVSRAVELEWQRNCVRHRDFITPGYLTVRFYVETNGKVKTVQFVGQMETGEVQKGFTLNSIRDADIPAMPASIKKDYEKAPLELIFNFYF